jgi:hypothetical protein
VASEEGKRRWLDQGFPREVTSAGRSIHPSIPCVVVVPSAACHATTVTTHSVCVDRRPRAPLPPPSLVVVRPASSPPALKRFGGCLIADTDRLATGAPVTEQCFPWRAKRPPRLVTSRAVAWQSVAGEQTSPWLSILPSFMRASLVLY